VSTVSPDRDIYSAGFARVATRHCEGAEVDFWDLTKLMFRRWYVSVPAFLVAIGVTLYVGSRVEPDYVATSYVQLVPPAITPKERDEKKASARNPWLDSGLASLTKAGMISVQDQRVVKQLESSGLSEDFTVTQDQQLPIVTFEVIGDDEAQATQTTERLVKRFTDSVQTLQDEYGAPEEQLITARRLDLGDNVEESTSKVKRALIAVAGVGVLLALALTVAADALLRRRRRKEDAAEPAEPEPSRAAAEVPAPRRDPDEKPAASAEPASPAEPTQPIKTATGKAAGKAAAGPQKAKKSGGEYKSQSAHPSIPGEETAVISRTPGEETIVLPSPTWPKQNGSKRP
jgi:hypothetical protein